MARPVQHPLVEPVVDAAAARLVAGLIGGFYLAYCYAHFESREGHRIATAVTTCYHTMINALGLFLIAQGWFA